MKNKILESLKPKVTPHKFLTTGSTLLNLAMTSKINGGFPLGVMTFLVGDSQSGKTFLALTCMAEAARLSKFDNYDFIYDDLEEGALMDFQEFFGSKMKSRLIHFRPKTEKDRTAEAFYYRTSKELQKAKKEGRSIIKVLDSQDALTSMQAIGAFEDSTKAYENDKSPKGSYGDGKAKVHSSNIRFILDMLRDTNSVLIVIGQTRDNIGFDATFNPKTRSGGKSLTFFAREEIWSSITGRLKKTVNGKEREYGKKIKCKIKKNSITGRATEVEFFIRDDYGIDDIQSMIHYLVEEGHWKEKAKVIEASEFAIAKKIDSLSEIFDSDKEKLNKLKSIVLDVWSTIEDSLKTKLKKKYQ